MLAGVLATPGLGWIAAATVLAGAVYGFVGFGAALVFMPLATIWLPPEVAVAAISLSALSSLATLVPRAWGAADLRETGILVAAAFATAPLGIWILRVADPEAIRVAVSLIVAGTLAALMAGLRVRAGAGTRRRVAVGAATGVLGGATGLMGPVVILFNLGSEGRAAERSRANTLVFLTFISLLILPQLALQGALTWATVALGALLLVPYGAGTLIGQALFRPGAERIYRAAAYAVIGAAALAGLPVWS